MKFIQWCNKVIEYSFYLIFFLVPIYFANNTSELYELNKMWLTWGVTIIIVVAWLSKMIASKRIVIQRTIFDLPLLGFLLSQFISTIFSLDTHVSLWGYYSRFNGGFYSMLSYVVLYYAFVTNYADIQSLHEEHTARFSKGIRISLLLAGFCIIPLAIIFAAPPASNPEAVHSTFLFLSLLASFLCFALSLSYSFIKRILLMSVISGVVVTLWGIPSHYGLDPTCYLFRGQLNVDCWTSAFYPTVRMFSTLGQPAWLTAYISIIIPLAIIFAAPPASNPEAVHSTFLFLSLLAAFLCFALSLSYSFIKRILLMSVISGVVVTLWGIPSHYGLDPTCYLFRGQLNVDCWTSAFYPTVRMFSTLGQPAWLTAYISIIIPLALAFVFITRKKEAKKLTETVIDSVSELLRTPYSLLFLFLTALFYVCLLFSNTKGGFVGFWVAYAIFWIIVAVKKIFSVQTLITYCLGVTAIFFFLNFVFSTPLPQLSKFTWAALTAKPEATTTNQSGTVSTSPSPTPAPAAGELGGTDSGQIRLYVWQGAIDIWKAHPLFGTGVETFAFAYYLHRPAGHNMTSEWDYLYNKAHNEYLNYLATTGIFGLGTYLIFIGFFLFLTLKYLFQKNEISGSSQLLILALYAGFISILISNFFGFSVVIINLYLFLIPAFMLVLANRLEDKKALVYPSGATESDVISSGAWFGIVTVSLIGFYLLFLLFIFREADIDYALGSNLDHVQEYVQAYPKLDEAVSTRPGEPVFKDELAINTATIGTLYLLQKDASQSAEAQQQAVNYINRAISLDDDVITNHPNNTVFWKNRVRLFYTLSQADIHYIDKALEAMVKVSELSPTDAKVFYNLGSLYKNRSELSKEHPDLLSQNPQDIQNARAALDKAVQLKPDYRDAYLGLGEVLHELAMTNDKVTDPSLEQQAVDNLQYILTHLAPNDTEVKQVLSSWNAL